MNIASLQDKLDGYASPVAMLRSSQIGPYVYPIPSEFSNWRDEQFAWRQTVALMDQSFHMTDLYLEGRDTYRLLSQVAVNSFINFGSNKAKQLIACNYDGLVIGDMIVFGLEENRVNVVGRPTVANWIEFHAATGGYDVRVERDERSIANPKARKTFRYELQGPNAWALLDELNGKPLGDIRFFSMCEVRIAGRPFRALRHGMGGAPGLEVWGPVEQAAEVKGRILEAGAQFGLREVGGRAYSSAAVDSGWIPSPMPSIFSGKRMQPYRAWLKATSFDAAASLGGSFYCDNIDDYYFSPWDLDYGRLINFDHEFIGRDALRAMAAQPHRRKVSLIWNSEDVVALYASLMTEGSNGKYMEMPSAHYATFPYDAVLHNGRNAGVSTYIAYLAPDRAWVSLAVIDEQLAQEGSQVTIVWGERDGGSARPVVERHSQREIRARVTGWPFSSLAQQGYR